MTTRATKESFRKSRAVPSPERTSSFHWGCLVPIAVLIAFFLLIVQFLPKPSAGYFALFFMITMITVLALTYILLAKIYETILLVAVQWQWTRHGIRCLVVHSDSPIWNDHIQNLWLPNIGRMARLLNWSENATWTSTLEVRLFRRFCQTGSNFNPAVLVFRGLRAPLVFRFYYAFQELKTGRPQYVETLETELFKSLGVSKNGSATG